MTIIPIEKWLEDRLNVEIVELQGSTIKQQLAVYDSANTGVGIVLAMAVMASDESEDKLYDMIPIPIFKIKNQWMTILEEGFSDLVRDVIILLIPKEDENV